MKKTLVFTLFVLFSIPLLSQDVKRKRVTSGNLTEIYFVLKEDKKIKHGQYIKYFKDALLRESIIEVGFYENGDKVGKWYSCYPNGQLWHETNYVNGSIHGLSIEYHLTQTISNANNLLVTTNSIYLNDDKNLEIDKSNLVVSSKGVYNSGRKSGAWEYYSLEGSLIHKFDHSEGQLIKSTTSDKNCPFLGGESRFRNFYHRQRQFHKKLPEVHTRVIVKILIGNSPTKYEILSSEGDENFSIEVIESLKGIPQDWVPSLAENHEVKFIAEFKVEPQRSYLISFK